MRLWGLMMAVLAVVTALVPLEAVACSCVELFAVSPAPDAGEVPTNVWVRVTGHHVEDLTLHQSDGGIVEVEVREPTGNATTHYLVPTSPLQKGETYTVLQYGESELTHFVVSADPDTSAPNFEGIREYTFSATRLFDGESSCGPTRAYNLSLYEIGDDATPRGDFFFHVYAGTSASNIDLEKPAVVLPPGIRTVGQTACGPFFDLDANPEPWVVVTAVDRAGNETRKGEPTRLAQGCGCTSTGGEATGLLPLFGLLLLGAGRRGRCLSVRRSTLR